MSYVTRTSGARPSRGASGAPAAEEAKATLEEARTALRRGATLLKYCRLSKPHVARFQLSLDETKLGWVSKNGKAKHVPIDNIADVLPAGGLLRTTTRTQNELTPHHVSSVSGRMLVPTCVTRFVVQYFRPSC
jgi:hypothetical protein